MGAVPVGAPMRAPLLSCPPHPGLTATNRSVVTWAIAVTFFNRFYTRKSMKKNNTFVSSQPRLC